MTILPKIERVEIIKEIKRQWPDTREQAMKEYTSRFEIINANNLPLSIAVKAIYHAGNLECALETTTMLSRFRPALAFLCGIAGNINHDKRKLADVVVSGSYAFKQFTRMSEGKHLESTLPTVPPISRSMQNLAQRIFAENTVDFTGDDIKDYTNGHPTQLALPKMEIGKIFCWDLVLDCNATRLELVQEDREYRAVEMELAGFLKAIETYRNFSKRPLDGLAFRGLSDPASGKTTADASDINFRAYAARNAARVMTTFIDKLTEHDMEIA